MFPCSGTFCSAIKSTSWLNRRWMVSKVQQLIRESVKRHLTHSSGCIPHHLYALGKWRKNWFVGPTSPFGDYPIMGYLSHYIKQNKDQSSFRMSWTLMWWFQNMIISGKQGISEKHRFFVDYGKNQVLHLPPQKKEGKWLSRWGSRDLTVQTAKKGDRKGKTALCVKFFSVCPKFETTSASSSPSGSNPSLSASSCMNSFAKERARGIMNYLRFAKLDVTYKGWENHDLTPWKVWFKTPFKGSQTLIQVSNSSIEPEGGHLSESESRKRIQGN